MVRERSGAWHNIINLRAKARTMELLSDHLQTFKTPKVLKTTMIQTNFSRRE
jgi:hypothetical protein